MTGGAIRGAASRVAVLCLLSLVGVPPAPAAEPLTAADLAFLERVDGIAALTVEVTAFPGPGGGLAEVLADTDFRDDRVATVAVRFRAGSYAADHASPNAVMRQRGRSTRDGQQKSLKVILDDGVKPWAGYRRINLNKHPYDLSMMRNKLAFDLLAGVPHIPTLRTAFVRLLLDGEDQGLYTVVESYTRRFFRARGLPDSGWLYRAEEFEFYRYADELRAETDPRYDRKAFERRLRIEGREEHGPLLTLLDELNDPARDIDATVARHFDRENYLTWLAVNILFDNMDTNAQNFLLYRAGAGQPWLFLPWDYDGAWGFHEQPNVSERQRARPLWWRGIANWWGTVLHCRFLSKPANLAALADRVDALARERFPRRRVAALLDRYAETVAPFAARPPDLKRWCYSDAANSPEKRVAQWRAEVERLADLVERNRSDFHDSLRRPLPVFIGDLEPRGEGRFAFRWDAAVDLQGEPVRYDAALATGPRFATGEVLFETRGTSATEIVLALHAPVGARFYARLKIRDARGNEQDPFDLWWDAENERLVPGMREIVIR